MTFGLVPTGFNAALTSDVRTLMETDEKTQIDPAIDLSTDQVLGQLNGIQASKLAELWELARVIYAGLDPAGAVGAQLDAACALSGTKRKGAKASTCLATLTGTPTQSFTANQITLNVAGQPANTWRNRDVITLDAAGNFIGAVFIATSTGPLQAGAGTLTVITSPVTGLATATNPLAATPGTNVELDTALRIRRVNELTLAGASTVDSIRTDLLQVAGVIQVSVVENATLLPDVNGIPGKAFRAIIWDGPSPAATNAAIAAVIWADKPAGIYADGSTVQTTPDSTGALQTVRFDRATQVLIYVSLTVVTNPATFTGGATAVQAALGAIMQKVGQNVISLAVEGIALGVAGVLDVSAFAIGTAPSPVAPTNIIIAATAIALFDPTRVVVTVT